MTVISDRHLGRRTFLAGLTAAGVLALPACSTMQTFSLTEAIRRLLVLSSERAFMRMTAPGGFWDQKMAELGLGEVLGKRGDTLTGILTSALLKQRMERSFSRMAERGADRAAPVVADAVRTIGIENAEALLRGGPTAATGFLRQQMAGRLIEVMVPELSDALRVADDPLVAQALAGLIGTDPSRLAHQFADKVDDVIWNEIGREEQDIRSDPSSTNDPLIRGVLHAR